MQLIGVSILCTAGAIWIIRQHSSFGRRFLNIALWGMVIWIAAIMMKALVDTPACQVFWSRLSYSGVGLLPPAWLLFAYRYATGESGKMKLWQFAILSATIVLTIAVVWTNPWHFMFYGPGSGHVNPVTRETIITKGPLYWPLIWFYYSFIMVALAIFAYCIYRSYGAFRLHFIVLIMLTLLPLGVSLAYTHLDITISGVNPTPFAIVMVLVMYVLLINDNALSQTASLAKEQIFLDIPNPMLVIARDGRVALANRRAVALFDFPAPYRDFMARDIPALSALAETLHVHDSDDYASELTVDGHTFEIHASHIIRPLGRGDTVMGWLIMFFDITRRHHSHVVLADELTEALRQNRLILDKALTDPLTGLLNRRALPSEFEALALAAQEDEHPLVLVMMDLDHFKTINDTYGHATGDLALTIVAEGLQKTFRAEDRKFRIGGEEFLILSSHVDVTTLMRRLDLLRDWVLAEGKARGPAGLTIHFSAGLSVMGPDGTDCDTLLGAADKRLYAAKLAGRNRSIGPE